MKTVILALVLSMLSVQAWAQTLDLTLFRADIHSLPADARAAYERAVESNNRIDQVGTVTNLAEAAAAAPEMLEIQWLFCQAAESYVRADNFGIDAAMEIANQAMDAYGRMLSSENLSPWARPVVERYYERLISLLNNIDEIIESRMEASDAYIVQASELRERADQIREQRAAEIREERSQPVSQTGVNSEDAINANPLLLPSRHYDHAQIRGRRDTVDANPSLLPSQYYRR
jgi:hypothetical protein